MERPAKPTPRNAEQTRRVLLKAAYDAVRKHGFHASNIDDILTDTGLAKGTLYYHFPTKDALGCAIIDEVLMPEIAARWVAPLAEAERPVEALCTLIEQAKNTAVEIEFGCPLSTLSQELASRGDEFRVRLNRIYDYWRGGIAQALRRAEAEGALRPGLDIDACAAFIVSAIEGALGIAKAARSPVSLGTALSGLLEYLRGLGR